MPYTERSRANLLREGIAGNRIFVTGNPILEVITHYQAADRRLRRSGRLGVENEPRKFFLVTMHRAENVDLEPRLRALDCGAGRTSCRIRIIRSFAACIPAPGARCWLSG